MRVPRYDGPQIESTNLPGVSYSDGGIDAEAMGAGVARAAARFGELGAKIALDQQEKVNDASLMQFKNRLSETETLLLHDPKSGAYAMKGSESFKLMDTVLPEWDRRQSEAVDALPRHLRDRGLALAQQSRNNVDTGLKRHILQETDKFEQQQSDSVVGNATNMMAMNYKDPARLAEEAANIEAGVERKLRGAPEETIAEAKSIAVSKGFMAVVERELQDNPEGAEDALTKYGDRLVAGDYAKLNSVVREKAILLEDENAAEAILVGAPIATQTFEGGETHKAGTGLAAIPMAQRKQLKYDAPELNAYAAHVEQKYNLPSGLLNALKNAGERSNSWQTSHAGAGGCMQFMPATAKRFGITDRTDPVQSIDAAGQYVRYLLKFFKGDVTKAVAAYNAGEGNVQKHGGVPPFKETRDYVSRVLPALGKPVKNAVEPRDTAIGTTRAPATEAEALQQAETMFSDNPRQRDRVQSIIRRKFAIKDMAERDANEAAFKSIYTKIYDAAGPSDLANILTPDELQRAKTSGRMDAFQSELDRRFAGGEEKPNPDLQLSIDNIIHQAATGKQFAVDYLKKLDPYDPSLKITRADRNAIANAKESFLSADLKKSTAAKADWATKEQRIASGIATLGYGKKDAEKEVAFKGYVRMVMQSAIEQNGGSALSPQQEDAIVKSAVTHFASDPNAWQGAKAADDISMGKPMPNGAAMHAEDRRAVDQLLTERGLPVTEANRVRLWTDLYMKGMVKPRAN